MRHRESDSFVVPKKAGNAVQTNGPAQRKIKFSSDIITEVTLILDLDGLDRYCFSILKRRFLFRG